MQRKHFAYLIAAVLAGLMTAPAVAGDGDTEKDDALKSRVESLQQQVEDIESKNLTLLRREINQYLAATEPLRSAQGEVSWTDAVTIDARWIGVVQGTESDCRCDLTLANGDVDLDFWAQVTDRVDLFINLTANANTDETFPDLGDGTQTASGITDGIGVNGTKPTDPGSITVYEAGIQYEGIWGENVWIIQIGALDPRRRFGQTRFDDENQYFLNNQFDDASSVLWLTDSTGRTVYGFYTQIGGRESVINVDDRSRAVGDMPHYAVSFGWFNVPGQFFSNGQAYVQFHARFAMGGRVANLRFYVVWDDFFINASPMNDGSLSGGFTWDWQASDTTGVFLRAAFSEHQGSGNDPEVNPVEWDAQVGFVMIGFLDARPDDHVGVAAGFTSLQQGTTLGPSTPFVDDLEVTIEVYWKFMLEDGKLQISPMIQFINEPGGNIGAEDALVALALRIYGEF